MAPRAPETPADRAAWARLWDLVAEPWERLGDLADFLGYGRTTVQEWLPEGRNAGAGSWSLLRLALRRTARKYPAQVPALVARVVEELFDVARPLAPRGRRPRRPLRRGVGGRHHRPRRALRGAPSRRPGRHPRGGAAARRGGRGGGAGGGGCRWR